MRFHAIVLGILLATLPTMAGADDSVPVDTSRGDRLLADYFRAQTARLAEQDLNQFQTKEEWLAQRDELHRQLREMLGLDPWPERTPLNAEITGTLDHDEFTVEKVAFESLPRLYVSGNLYVPKKRDGPLPAILYVCGHGRVERDGVSLGNKTHYQHHPAWFARHGYVCLAIDTIQLGEIEGLHHGTYREGMWWWNARGYTPAGVEAWNGIRALDYLESREEVDAARLGVTGRSGGGAYSWWVAALDDRIKAAVPVAGITDLQNHVVDGVVEGHCDCMFLVNTYGWEYARVAALVAPRPLLIANSDSDGIFPLDGVYRLHEQVRHIYELFGAEKQLGLLITPGPHSDTQELQVPAFRWFNHYLKQDDTPIAAAAEKFFEPEELKVWSELPDDERTSTIHETFVPLAENSLPRDAEHWNELVANWRQALDTKSFAGWPTEAESLDVGEAWRATHDEVELIAYDFVSQEHVPLRLYVLHRAGDDNAEMVVLNCLDEAAWQEWLAAARVGFADVLNEEALPEPDEVAYESLQEMFRSFNWSMAYVAPRGIGPTAWDGSEKKQIQNRRRFMLLGQTLDGMRVWDVRRAIQALRETPYGQSPVWLQAERQMAGVALYASLYESGIERIDLWEMPASHRDGPILLNVLRSLDVPQAVAMAAERAPVRIYDRQHDPWFYPLEVRDRLGWASDRLQIRQPPAHE